MSPNSSGNRDLADICSYDIVNGRRLTTEEKQRLVAASFGSGVSVREFATRQGIGYSSLTRWRRQYARPPADSSPGFVPVALTDRQDVPDNSSDCQGEASLSKPVEETGIARIIITLCNGRRLEVRETIPPRTLKHLLSVLEGA
ncbi:IS66-like element accessory protein TnpA [Thalassospira mesophila]|uniref:IS66-like element accessory protein TnpA n=1 Tax=Thalassospira mesophila TaxID=1293891 RepID=UPI000A1EA020|nr:transposase [Thalassospira mesophila]